MNKLLTTFALLGLLAVTTLVYYKSLDNPLVFDDYGLTGLSTDERIKNDTITFPIGAELGSFLQSRVLPMWSFEELYTHTKNIVAHRSINLLIHLINSLLVFVMLWQFTKNNVVAYLITALFALNPAAIYGVAYLINRTIIMVAMFGLLEVVLCHAAVAAERSRDSIVYWLLALLAYLLAISCKEHAFPLVVVFPLMVMLYRPKINNYIGVEGVEGLVKVNNTSSRERIKYFVYVLLTLVLSIYFLNLGIKANSHWQVENGYYENIVKNMCGITGDIWHRSITTQAYLFFKYFWLWINPFAARSIDMREAFAATQYSAPQIYGLVAYGLWLIVGLWLLIKRSVLGFGMLLLWCLYLVEIQTVRLGELMVIYRSYLFSIAYTIIAAWLFNKANLHKKALACLGGALIIVFGAKTFGDLDQFQSVEKVWRQAASIIDPKSPQYCQAARIYSNWGATLIHEGRAKEAPPILDKAIAIGTYYGASAINAGSACLLMGDTTGAKKYYEMIKDSHESTVKDAAQKGIEQIKKLQGE